MPISPTYPGVYVEEIPSGVRTIMGVPTSVTAFIGRTKWGPVNVPVVINNYGDFERQFGGLWKESAISYSVKDFFMNGGAQAVIVRLFRPITDGSHRDTDLANARTSAKGTAEAIIKQAITDEGTATLMDITPAVESVVQFFANAKNTSLVSNDKASQLVADALALMAANASKAEQPIGRAVMLSGVAQGASVAAGDIVSVIARTIAASADSAASAADAKNAVAAAADPAVVNPVCDAAKAAASAVYDAAIKARSASHPLKPPTADDVYNSAKAVSDTYSSTATDSDRAAGKAAAAVLDAIHTAKIASGATARDATLAAKAANNVISAVDVQANKAATVLKGAATNAATASATPADVRIAVQIAEGALKEWIYPNLVEDGLPWLSSNAVVMTVEAAANTGNADAVPEGGDKGVETARAMDAMAKRVADSYSGATTISAVDSLNSDWNRSSDTVAKRASNIIAGAMSNPINPNVPGNAAVAASVISGMDGTAELIASKVSDAAAQAVTWKPNAYDVIIAVSDGSGAAVDRAAETAVPLNKARITLGTAADSLVLEAASEGAWGNNLRARVDYDTREPEAGEELFNLSIKDCANNRVETIRNVSVQKGNPRLLDKVLENESGLARAMALSTSRPAESPAPPKGKDPFDAATSYPATEAASDSDVLIPQDYYDENKGFNALDKTDIFNLLCIPPDERLKDTDPAVYTAAAAYCVKKRAMLIVDPSFEWGQKGDEAPGEASSRLADLGIKGTDARNAILYFPRVIEADPLTDGQLDLFPPSGIIAGVIARTDAQRGVWKAPAGIDASLNGIRGIHVNLTDDQNGMLNPKGINCLRTLPAVGQVIWGARTLRGADVIGDEYKYVPVRRLALFIEETLYRNLQWVVFEPNDEPLWSQIRLNVGAFMHGLFRQGAFQGSMPQEAYFVKCDKETNPQDEINMGRVNIIVGFAPLKPAEFVIIKIQQIAGSIQT